MTFVGESIIESLEMNSEDRVLCLLPLSFGYGLFQLLMCVRLGATLVLEQGFAFAGRVVELLERERITILPGVPSVFAVLTSLEGLADRDLPHLRFLTNAGAGLPEAARAEVRRTFPGARPALHVRADRVPARLHAAAGRAGPQARLRRAADPRNRGLGRRRRGPAAAAG